jgi:hypothetical protein
LNSKNEPYGSTIERILESDHFSEIDPARAHAKKDVANSDFDFCEIDNIFSKGIHFAIGDKRLKGLTHFKSLLNISANDILSTCFFPSFFVFSLFRDCSYVLGFH